MYTNIDKDTDAYCNDLLKEVAELNKKLSAQITKRVKKHPTTKDKKILRKLARISIVYTEYRPLYEQARENLRALPEWRTPPLENTISKIYKSVHKLITD